MVNKLKKYHKDIEIYAVINGYNEFLDLVDFFICQNYMISYFGDNNCHIFTHFSDSVFVVPDMPYYTEIGTIECYGLC